MLKKLALLLALAMIVSLTASNALGVTLNIRLTDKNDDIEERVSNGAITNDSDLELAYDGAGNPAKNEQWVGLRFTVAIPKGAKVTNAYLEFEVDAVNKEGSLNPVNLVIEGQLVPNAAPLTTTAKSLTSRGPWTTAKAKWSVPGWTATNAKFQTSDISAVIEEIVNQAGWASGNAMLLIVRDDKDNPSIGLREAESVDGEAAAAPLLHLEFTPLEASEPAPADGAKDISDAIALYVVVQDSTGKNAVATHADPAAVQATAWTLWKIPLSSLTGVNLAAVKRLYVGIGDRQKPAMGGAGRIYIDDIRVTK